MVKIFVTGDNHFGRKYDRYPEAREILLQSRFDSFRDMVRKAEAEDCEVFVVTGDLFDSTGGVKTADVAEAARLLAAFRGTVLVLPGNHDYYTGEERVWKDFTDALSNLDHNVLLLSEARRYRIRTKEEVLDIYPALCQSKHSRENSLGWIREEKVSREGVINLGIAHGALKGITPDRREEYFLMTEQELEAIPMDAWLLGHTHIPYPQRLAQETETTGYRIFNPGTHEQTDLHNRTEGNCFLLRIEKSGTEAIVWARRYVSGRVRFYDLALQVSPDSDSALEDGLRRALAKLPQKAVIRLRLTGSLRRQEYQRRAEICREQLGAFLSYEVEDAGLSEEITKEKIRTEYAQSSFAARFLEAFLDQPSQLQMAYELLKECGAED